MLKVITHLRVSRLAISSWASVPIRLKMTRHWPG